MLKHVHLTLFAALIAMASFTAGAFASHSGFMDVPASHWASDAVTFVSETGLMKGPSNRPGYFMPDEPVTRAQLATVLHRAMGGVSYNPSTTTNLSDARDAQRRSDVNTILNAIYQYAIDNNGTIPSDIPTGAVKEICNSRASSCGDRVNLNVLTGSYIVQIPLDPSIEDSITSKGTGYWVMMDSNGRLTVTAKNAENGAISVTR